MGVVWVVVVLLLLLLLALRWFRLLVVTGRSERRGRLVMVWVPARPLMMLGVPVRARGGSAILALLVSRALLVLNFFLNNNFFFKQ